jgi:phospholipase/carboxylesterase
MVALETALRSPEPPAALFLFSCGLCDEKGLRAAAPVRAGLRVLQSHGASDPLLSFEAAKRLSGILTEAGLDCEFVEFEGGHAIGPGVLERLGRLIDAVCMRPAD